MMDGMGLENTEDQSNKPLTEGTDMVPSTANSSSNVVQEKTVRFLPILVSHDNFMNESDQEGDKQQVTTFIINADGTKSKSALSRVFHAKRTMDQETTQLIQHIKDETHRKDEKRKRLLPMSVVKPKQSPVKSNVRKIAVASNSSPETKSTNSSKLQF